MFDMIQVCKTQVLYRYILHKCSLLYWATDMQFIDLLYFFLKKNCKGIQNHEAEL